MLRGPHASLPEDKLVKAQAMVGFDDKQVVKSACLTPGLHEFLIQHAYSNVANFIRTNDLNFTHANRVAEYIANGFRDRAGKLADPASPQPVAGGDERVRTPSVDTEPTPTPRRRTSTEKGTGRGGRGGKTKDGDQKA